MHAWAGEVVRALKPRWILAMLLAVALTAAAGLARSNSAEGY